MKSFFVFFIILLIFSNRNNAQKRPNIVFIMTDDQGYQDLGCYGSTNIKTPNIDNMAKNGLKFTEYYVSSSVSSPSRAGFMTGKFNNNNGVRGVLWPGDDGLPLSEKTISEILKENGYSTACIGKWHLGDTEGHLPTSRGFDLFYGIPYSNDMYIGPTQKISDKICLRNGYTLEMVKDLQHFVKTKTKEEIVARKLKGKCPLFYQDEIVEFPCEQSTLTKRYFDEAINFIEKNKETPFFLYLTPNMPHVPLSVSSDFYRKSKRGLYGDVIEEIDWNVGRLLKFIENNNLSDNTIVVFTSDNGPWLVQKENGGSANPLRDGKGSLYEGGLRVPCIVMWKNHILKNVVCDEIMINVDWFPTFLHYANIKYNNLNIDGINCAELLENSSVKIRNQYPYIKGGNICGLRKDEWIYLPKSGEKSSNINSKPELFNIDNDISQKNNLYNCNPQKVKELEFIMKNLNTNSYEK